ncbi:hypothetical protein HZA71_01405 [Candidatus Falkowbacteria bacterium]|nr:hypothetical protein [Candidatus Falkowbacteria bacterium]
MVTKLYFSKSSTIPKYYLTAYGGIRSIILNYEAGLISHWMVLDKIVL